MSKQVGFRCPELLHSEIESYRKGIGLSKTDAIVNLIEIAFTSLDKAKNEYVNTGNERIEMLLRLVVQQLAVINQLGDLAGEDVMKDAEAEYKDLLNNLGLKQ